MELINKWFLENPSILVLAVPLLSGFVGWLTAFYATRRVRRSEKERIQFERLMKVSEFRQSWINSLRDCMAEFQSYGVTPEMNPASNRQFYALGTKIELLMNPSDDDYKLLHESLYNFLDSSKGDICEKYKNNAQYIAVCQRILKREWERLKEELNDPTRFINTRRGNEAMSQHRIRQSTSQEEST